MKKYLAFCICCLATQLITMECRICLGRIKDDSSHTTACGACYFAPCSTSHFFHDTCLQSWIRQCENDNREADCPICRGRRVSAANAAFLTAVQSGDLHQVQETQNNAQAGVNNNVALLIATHFGRLPVLRHLIENLGLNANHMSLVNVAVLRHHESVARYLLEGQDPVPAFRIALETKKYDLIDWLCKHCSKEQLTETLCALARGGLAESVELLCTRSSTARKCITDALRVAIIANQLAVIRFFMETGRINNQLAKSMVELSAELGQVNVLRYLLEERHVTTDALPLILLAANNGQVAVIEYLMHQPAVTEALNTDQDPRKESINQTIGIAIKKALRSKNHGAVVLYFLRNKHGNLGEHIKTIVSNGDVAIIREATEQHLLDEDIMECAALQAIELGKNAISAHLFDTNPHLAQRLFLRTLAQRNDNAALYIAEHQQERLNTTECLLNAIEYDRTPVIHFLASHHDWESESDVNKILSLAAIKGDLDLIKNFIDCYHGETGIDEALYLAHCYQHHAIVDYLASHRKTTVEMLQNAIFMAINSDHRRLISYLMQKIEERGHEINLTLLITKAFIARNNDVVGWLTMLRDDRAFTQRSCREALDAKNFDMLKQMITQRRMVAACNARMSHRPEPPDPVNIQDLAIYAIQQGNILAVQYLSTHETARCDFNELLRWAHRLNKRAIEVYLTTTHRARINFPEFERWRDTLPGARAAR